jgi:hypothetical protein
MGCHAMKSSIGFRVQIRNSVAGGFFVKELFFLCTIINNYYRSMFSVLTYNINWSLKLLRAIFHHFRALVKNTA